MVVAKKATYEESRQKRLEENKKRMEDLNLNKLAQSLHSTKSSPMKKVKPKLPKLPLDPSSIRRSSRDKPAVSYKEVGIEPLERAGRRSYSNNRTNSSNRVYASDEDREYATHRAEDLQSGLDQDIPSFVKPMLHSHVTQGFWLGLPVQFCKKNLSSAIVTPVNLIDEQGKEYPAKYLGLKTGLSGGWRGFALDHKLVDGDALVFQFIKPTTFKVYIVRVNEPGDGEN